MTGLAAHRNTSGTHDRVCFCPRAPERVKRPQLCRTVIALFLLALTFASLPQLAAAPKKAKPTISTLKSVPLPIKRPPLSNSGRSDAKSSTAKPSEPKVLTEWSAEETAIEVKVCKEVLDGVPIIALPEKGFRKGACGAAAPVRLIAVGASPQVVLSPPAIMTCRMARAVHDWTTRDVQRLAKKHLKEEIIRIEVMSDYSCRNTYGRKVGKLSEHAFANALDVRGFSTASGKAVRLLKDWGPTARDIAAEKARLKAQREARLAAEREAEDAAAAQEAEQENKSADVGRKKSAKQIVVTGSKKLVGVGKKLATAAKTAIESVAPENDFVPLNKRISIGGYFLRDAHVSACKIFGTTLGPEANNAHRNHFHLDMRPRKRSNFCE